MMPQFEALWQRLPPSSMQDREEEPECKIHNPIPRSIKEVGHELPLAPMRHCLPNDDDDDDDAICSYGVEKKLKKKKHRHD